MSKNYLKNKRPDSTKYLRDWSETALISLNNLPPGILQALATLS